MTFRVDFYAHVNLPLLVRRRAYNNVAKPRITLEYNGRYMDVIAHIYTRIPDVPHEEDVLDLCA